MCKPLWSFIASATSWGPALLLIMLAYVAGELVSGLARRTLGRLRDSGGDGLLPTAAERLEAGLREYYRLRLAGEEFRRARFDLAFSLVWNRVPSYHVFLARSDLNRSLSLICGAAAAVGFAGALGLPLSVRLGVPHLIGLGVGCILMGVQFLSRARYFFAVSRRIIYYSAQRDLTLSPKPAGPTMRSCLVAGTARLRLNP